eukprot:2585264-Amphidinium_carterae.1
MVRRSGAYHATYGWRCFDNGRLPLPVHAWAESSWQVFAKAAPQVGHEPVHRDQIDIKLSKKTHIDSGVSNKYCCDENDYNCNSKKEQI